MTRARSSPLGTAFRLGALCAGVLAVAACNRAEEADLRAKLAGWVPLGETLSFSASRSCAAGMFDLVGTRIASRMRRAETVREAAMILKTQDEAAIDAPGQSPDAALTALIGQNRSAGMRMRMAALEGRTCMEEATEAAFSSALTDPAAVVLMDVSEGILALLDPRGGVLIVAMGAE